MTITTRPVLVLVRVHPGRVDGRDVIAKLQYLGRVFNRHAYPNCVLVYFHRGALEPDEARGRAAVELEMWSLDQPWLQFRSYHDVYSHLLRGELGGDALDPDDTQYRFAFAVFINLRRDQAEAGFGYGLPEVRGERCPLRAALLATRGNAVCLDWGVPSDLGDDYRGSGSVQALAEMLDHDIYEFSAARMRRQGDKPTRLGLPPFHSSQQPFARVIRNGHYLGVFKSSVPELPETMMSAIEAGARERLLDAPARRRGWWLGWWDLYFAEDGYQVPAHQWRRFPWLQFAATRRYELARSVWVSSTPRERAVDASILVALSVAAALVDVLAFRHEVPAAPTSVWSFAAGAAQFLVDVCATASVTLALYAAHDVAFEVHDRYHYRRVLNQSDRPAHEDVAWALVPFAVHAPVAVRPALVVLFRLTMDVGLHALRSGRRRREYVEWRFFSPSEAVRFEAPLYVAMAIATWTWPRIAGTWGDVARAGAGAGAVGCSGAG